MVFVKVKRQTSDVRRKADSYQWKKNYGRRRVDGFLMRSNVKGETKSCRKEAISRQLSGKEIVESKD